MKNRTVVYAFVVVVSYASFFFALSQEKPQKSEPEAVRSESFIRMDLLSGEKKPMPPPKRNIFTQKGNAVFEDLSPEEIQEKIAEAMSRPDSQQEGESEMLPLNIRYLGYVLSGRKTVGLIVFGGEALAVLEGDMIAEGYTVGRVRPEEIEVLGPDEKPLMFSIEGEFP